MMENVNNFLTEIIDEDIANGLSERIHTRFPPEPNGYLHIGSAKAIFINWSIAKKYNGLFNLRYDDTNPVKEDTEYVDSIWEDIKWLTGEEPSGGVFYGGLFFSVVRIAGIAGFFQSGSSFVPLGLGTGNALFTIGVDSVCFLVGTF